MLKRVFSFIMWVSIICPVMCSCYPSQGTKETEDTDPPKPEMIIETVSSPRDYKCALYTYTTPPYKRHANEITSQFRVDDDPKRIHEKQYGGVRKCKEIFQNIAGENLAVCVAAFSENGLSDSDIETLFKCIGFSAISVSTESLSETSHIEYNGERFSIFKSNLSRGFDSPSDNDFTKSRIVCRALTVSIAMFFCHEYFNYSFKEKYLCPNDFDLLGEFYENEQATRMLLAKHGVNYTGFFFADSKNEWKFGVMFKELGESASISLTSF